MPRKAISITRDPYGQTRRDVLKAREKTLAEHKKKLAHHEPKKKINWKKIVIWVVVIAAIVWLWKQFDIPRLVISLLQQNPAVWNIYQAVMAEVESRSLLGLLYASFFGSLFFISLPVEAIFLYYLGLNYYVVQIIIVVLIGNILGMLINYGFGRLIGEKVIKYFMKDNYKKFMKKLERAGAFIILIGNILPFPIEPFAVFLGAVKYRFSWFLTYTIIGKVIKFVLLAIGYMYFVKYASPYLSTISGDWFIDSIKNVFVFW